MEAASATNPALIAPKHLSDICGLILQLLVAAKLADELITPLDADENNWHASIQLQCKDVKSKE